VLAAFCVGPTVARVSEEATVEVEVPLTCDSGVGVEKEERAGTVSPTPSIRFMAATIYSMIEKKMEC